MHDDTRAFTTFAVAVHAADGVEAACLRLQDDAGVDVDVLLFAAYLAARHHRVLGAAEIAEVTDRVGPWQREVVAHLRALRRRLRDGPDPAPNESTEVLRALVRDAELRAEFVELATLARLCTGRGAPEPAPGSATDTAEAVRSALRVVIDHARRTRAGAGLDSDHPDDHACLRVVADAACAVADADRGGG